MSSLIRLLIAGSLGTLSVVASVQAQPRAEDLDCSIEREVAAGVFTETTYNRLSRIYEDIGEQAYDDAYGALETVLGRVQRNAFEQAVIFQAMGYVRMQQDRPDEAIDHFRQALALDVLPNSEHFEMILTVANLHYGMDRFQDALDKLDLWFCLTPDDKSDNADVWVMKASIHAQKDAFRQALDALGRAIALSDDPRESWYRFKLGMHLELEEFRPAIEVLRVLIPMNPDNKSYWLKMSSLYAELGQQSESKSTLNLAYRRGLLNQQSEFLQLASLLQAEGAPRRAAEVMHDGLDRGVVEGTRRHWEMVAGAWYEARELDKALSAYERAGAKSLDGKIDLQRGFLLVDLERWDEAGDALYRSLDLGGLDENETGNVWLLLGMSKFNLGNHDAALQAFNKAANYRRVVNEAREWANHVREERGRRSGQ